MWLVDTNPTTSQTLPYSLRVGGRSCPLVAWLARAHSQSHFNFSIPQISARVLITFTEKVLVVISWSFPLAWTGVALSEFHAASVTIHDRASTLTASLKVSIWSHLSLRCTSWSVYWVRWCLSLASCCSGLSECGVMRLQHWKNNPGKTNSDKFDTVPLLIGASRLYVRILRLPPIKIPVRLCALQSVPNRSFRALFVVNTFTEILVQLLLAWNLRVTTGQASFHASMHRYRHFYCLELQVAYKVSTFGQSRSVMVAKVATM
mgnify:CR=1 FL=1